MLPSSPAIFNFSKAPFHVIRASIYVVQASIYVVQAFIYVVEALVHSSLHSIETLCESIESLEDCRSLLQGRNVWTFFQLLGGGLERLCDKSEIWLWIFQRSSIHSLMV